MVGGKCATCAGEGFVVVAADEVSLVDHTSGNGNAHHDHEVAPTTRTPRRERVWFRAPCDCAAGTKWAAKRREEVP